MEIVFLNTLPHFILPIMKNKLLAPVVSIIAGCCVLLFPALLNYVVAIYLILTGVLAIANKG